MGMEGPEQMENIEWRQVTFHYPDSEVPALSHINLSVRAGEFVVICGPSGSGKTTLLRLLKREVAPGGRLSGAILLNGVAAEHLRPREAASAIGLVMQHPDNQLVVDAVEHELAFGMENLGMPRGLMRRRMAEIAGFFGLEPLLSRSVDELSGGQKMTVNLASVLMLQPQVLLLDEPLSQLDPLAARELLGLIKRLNGEWGITVIISEHRIDDLLPLADRVVRLERGGIGYDGTPRAFAAEAWRRRDPAWLEALPAVTRWALGWQADRRTESISLPDLWPPLSVNEARKQWRLLKARAGADAASMYDRDSRNSNEPRFDDRSRNHAAAPLLLANDLFFAYDKRSPAVLRGLNWTIRQGDRIALFGGNGSGKSTLLQLMAGLRQPQRGEVRLQGDKLSRIPAAARYARIGYLAQNPLLHFAHDTLREDLLHAAKRAEAAEAAAFGSRGESSAPHHSGNRLTALEAVHHIADRMGLERLLDRHPHDLSGGERQLGALALALLGRPQLLLLDEPTKGIDAEAKTRLTRHLDEAHQAGTALVIATHDVEFAAAFASRCALLFQGEIVADEPPDVFFQGNLFYAPPLYQLLNSIQAGRSAREAGRE